MYTLLDGTKVKELRFATGKGAWEIYQWYWYNGKKAQQAYNTETGEIRIYDANGNDIILIDNGNGE